MPKDSAQIHDGYIASICDTDSPVKPKMKNVTESAQFKRWFGNWVENPEKASKIVNADGSPEILKLYVEEMYNPSGTATLKRAYQLQNIESQQLSVKGSSDNVTLASSFSTADIHTVADLFQAVKQRDKKFSPKAASQIVNEDGSPIAPVVIDGFGFQNNVRIDSNAVTSIHGRKNAISRLLANAVEKEASGNTAIYFWNREKAIALLQQARDTMPKSTALMPQVRTASAAAANISDGYIHSIYDDGSPVKARYSAMKSRSAESYESEIERLKKQRDEAKRQIKLSKYQQVSPAGIKRMAQDLLAEYRSTANTEELIDTLNKSDSFLNQTCFFNLRYTVRYMVEKLAAPPSRLEIGSARKTPLTPSPAKCGRRSVSGMTTMPFRKMEKKMA